MNLYLYRIYGGSWGFIVVALIAEDEAQAKKLIENTHRGHFGDNWRKGYAELMDSCSVALTNYVMMEYDE